MAGHVERQAIVREIVWHEGRPKQFLSLLQGQDQGPQEPTKSRNALWDWKERLALYEAKRAYP